MEQYEGVVQDRVVVLPEEVHLKEGQRVVIHIREAGHESSEDLFKQRLVERGLLERIARPSGSEEGRDRTPIQVKGKPLSELIIEERR